jgi:hypothetical protein
MGLRRIAMAIKKGLSSAAVGIAALLALLLFSKKTGATGLFVCPIDGLKFNTQQALIDHYATAHPGVPVPIQIIWD